MSFAYLRIAITSNRNNFRQVKQEAIRVKYIKTFKRYISWNNTFLTREAKVKINKTMVRPILSYRWESRAESSKTKHLLRTAGMKAIRTIIRKIRWNKVQRMDWREACQIQDSKIAHR